MTNDNVSSGLYFEDLEVGRRLTTASTTIDAEAIKDFASRFDPQPFHLDEAAAKDSFFGTLVASGWHTAALTMRLLVTSGLPIAGGVIGAGGELQWPRPVRPGETLHVEIEIVAATPSRSRPERGMVTVRCETKASTDDIVQIMTARLVVPRRSGNVTV